MCNALRIRLLINLRHLIFFQFFPPRPHCIIDYTRYFYEVYLFRTVNFAVTGAPILIYIAARAFQNILKVF
jgi:hypothetical protein